MQKRKRKPGGGRKPAPYKTTTVSVRVRTEWVGEVKEAITNTINNLKSQTMTNTIPTPVNGAAQYYCGIDNETGKYCVIMKDTEGYTSIIEHAKTMEAAQKKAIKWQTQENKSVQSND